MTSSIALSRLHQCGSCGVILIGALFVDAVRAAPEEIDAPHREAIIEGALSALSERYVVPASAERMRWRVATRAWFGRYDTATNPVELARLLTYDLRDVSHDLHLSIRYIARALPQPEAPPPPGASAPLPASGPVGLDEARGFGFAHVEQLAGNIGYVELRGFDGRPEVAQAAATVMNRVAGCDAIIFDLRANGGGAPRTVALILSYLFEEPVHLNDFFDRDGQLTGSSWTLAEVAGQRIADKDVYVLISGRTFSGGEEFVYDLKSLKRATLVGENTRGGAHTVEVRRLDDHFLLTVPSGRPMNAVTKSNWERAGVRPDVAVDEAAALLTAHRLALRKLATIKTPGEPRGSRLRPSKAARCEACSERAAPRRQLP